MCVTKKGEVGCAANLLPLVLMYTQVGFLWNKLKWKYGEKKQFQRTEGYTTETIFCQWNLMICLNFKAYFIVRACEPLALLCLTRCTFVC